MASEEAKFAARADRLAGRQGVAGFMPASARAAQPAPTNRYIMPQFVEKTPYGMKTQDAYSRLFEDRIIFLGVQVDDASADDVMAQLLVLESQDPNRDVMMYIRALLMSDYGFPYWSSYCRSHSKKHARRIRPLLRICLCCKAVIHAFMTRECRSICSSRTTSTLISNVMFPNILMYAIWLTSADS